MSKHKNIVSLTLQAFGILFIVCLLGLGFLLFSSPGTKETIKNAKQVNGYLIRAGLSVEQPIKVISGSAHYHPFMDDYNKDWCVQLEQFEIAMPFQYQWQGEENIHPIVHILKRPLQSDLQTIAATCFDKTLSDDDGLMYFLLDVRTSGQAETLNFDNISGFEAMVYDPESRRIAFYGSQT